MAVRDIAILEQQLPLLFERRDPRPPGGTTWVDEWIVIPTPGDPDRLPDFFDDPSFDSAASDLPMTIDDSSPIAPWVGSTLPPAANSGLPGSLVTVWGGHVIPPDALAFYLPFHYYFPDWWGIYLTIDGVASLGRYIHRRASHTLSMSEARLVAQIFLYGHEVYHHRVECFATRLETTHRTPLYRKPFENLYRDKMRRDPDNCMEEVLASAHGLRLVGKMFPRDKSKRHAAQQAVRDYINISPPGYRRSNAFEKSSKFQTAQDEFAEENHRASFPSAQAVAAMTWRTNPHAFTGMGRINSRISYLIPRQSSLAQRAGLHLRYLRYRDVAHRLKVLRCNHIRNGKHQVWASPNGQHFPVPHHPGDMPRRTILSLLK